jgi:anti-sigma factor (TIGR02949 family)
VDLYESSCDEVLRDLDLYLDGELPPARARVVERHLSTCSPCLARSDFRRKLAEVIRRKCMTADEPPESLHIRIRRSIGLRITEPPEEA